MRRALGIVHDSIVRCVGSIYQSHVREGIVGLRSRGSLHLDSFVYYPNCGKSTPKESGEGGLQLSHCFVGLDNQRVESILLVCSLS